MSHDIFISYSTEDQEIVEELSAYLEQNGIRCFVAYRDIPKGIDWAGTITAAIEKSKLMIIVFSEHFNRSKQVDREITLCIEENKPILTFKIQNAAFTGTKKYYLQNLNWIDAFPNPEKSFKSLYNNVLQLIPEIRLQKEKQEEKTEEKQTDLDTAFHWRHSRIPYLAGGIAAICLILLIIWLSKPGNDSDNTSISTNDTTNVESFSPIIASDTSEMNSDNISTEIIPLPALNSEENKHPEIIPLPSQNSEKNKSTDWPSPYTKYTEITYTTPTLLTSTSGEQFTAIEGDTFKGDMKSNKIVQGKVIRDGTTVKTFFEKRNH
jgi:hypothetical protein